MFQTAAHGWNISEDSTTYFSTVRTVWSKFPYGCEHLQQLFHFRNRPVNWLECCTAAGDALTFRGDGATSNTKLSTNKRNPEALKQWKYELAVTILFPAAVETKWFKEEIKTHQGSEKERKNFFRVLLSFFDRCVHTLAEENVANANGSKIVENSTLGGRPVPSKAQNSQWETLARSTLLCLLRCLTVYVHRTYFKNGAVSHIANIDELRNSGCSVAQAAEVDENCAPASSSRNKDHDFIQDTPAVSEARHDVSVAEHHATSTQAKDSLEATDQLAWGISIFYRLVELRYETATKVLESIRHELNQPDVATAPPESDRGRLAGLKDDGKVSRGRSGNNTSHKVHGSAPERAFSHSQLHNIRNADNASLSASRSTNNDPASVVWKHCQMDAIWTPEPHTSCTVDSDKFVLGPLLGFADEVAVELHNSVASAGMLLAALNSSEQVDIELRSSDRYRSIDQVWRLMTQCTSLLANFKSVAESMPHGCASCSFKSPTWPDRSRTMAPLLVKRISGCDSGYCYWSRIISCVDLGNSQIPRQDSRNTGGNEKGLESSRACQSKHDSWLWCLCERWDKLARDSLEVLFMEGLSALAWHSTRFRASTAHVVKAAAENSALEGDRNCPTLVRNDWSTNATKWGEKKNETGKPRNSSGAKCVVTRDLFQDAGDGDIEHVADEVGRPTSVVQVIKRQATFVLFFASELERLFLKSEDASVHLVLCHWLFPVRNNRIGGSTTIETITSSATSHLSSRRFAKCYLASNRVIQLLVTVARAVLECLTLDIPSIASVVALRHTEGQEVGCATTKQLYSQKDRDGGHVGITPSHHKSCGDSLKLLLAGVENVARETLLQVYSTVVQILAQARFSFINNRILETPYITAVCCCRDSTSHDNYNFAPTLSDRATTVHNTDCTRQAPALATATITTTQLSTSAAITTTTTTGSDTTTAAPLGKLAAAAVISGTDCQVTAGGLRSESDDAPLRCCPHHDTRGWCSTYGACCPYCPSNSDNVPGNQRGSGRVDSGRSDCCRGFCGCEKPTDVCRDGHDSAELENGCVVHGCKVHAPCPLETSVELLLFATMLADGMRYCLPMPGSSGPLSRHCRNARFAQLVHFSGTEVASNDVSAVQLLTDFVLPCTGPAAARLLFPQPSDEAAASTESPSGEISLDWQLHVSLLAELSDSLAAAAAAAFCRRSWLATSADAEDRCPHDTGHQLHPRCHCAACQAVTFWDSLFFASILVHVVLYTALRKHLEALPARPPHAEFAAPAGTRNSCYAVLNCSDTQICDPMKPRQHDSTSGRPPWDVPRFSCNKTTDPTVSLVLFSLSFWASFCRHITNMDAVFTAFRRLRSPLTADGATRAPSQTADDTDSVHGRVISQLYSVASNTGGVVGQNDSIAPRTVDASRPSPAQRFLLVHAAPLLAVLALRHTKTRCMGIYDAIVRAIDFFLPIGGSNAEDCLLGLVYYVSHDAGGLWQRTEAALAPHVTKWLAETRRLATVMALHSEAPSQPRFAQLQHSGMLASLFQFLDNIALLACVPELTVTQLVLPSNTDCSPYDLARTFERCFLPSSPVYRSLLPTVPHALRGLIQWHSILIIFRQRRGPRAWKGDTDGWQLWQAAWASCAPSLIAFLEDSVSFAPASWASLVLDMCINNSATAFFTEFNQEERESFVTRRRFSKRMMSSAGHTVSAPNVREFSFRSPIGKNTWPLLRKSIILAAACLERCSDAVDAPLGSLVWVLVAREAFLLQSGLKQGPILSRKGDSNGNQSPNAQRRYHFQRAAERPALPFAAALVVAAFMEGRC